ncbi:MAG: hypothetical protein QG578_1809 [Thermodesulfobacteriota bacterium]|nr:hypothetical protein [Thermodesulfobacteriota bacterium]
MDVESWDNLPEQKLHTPPRFFHHEALFESLGSSKTIDKTDLTNIINHIHFTGGHLFVLMQHPLYEDKLLACAHPEPCIDDQLTLRLDASYDLCKLESYKPIHLVIKSNQSFIAAPIGEITCNKTGFTIQLHELSYELNTRKVNRYACRNISAEIMQGDFAASGELVDFSPVAFRIRANSDAFKHNSWFNPETQVSVRLYFSGKIVYSGFCRCIRLLEEYNVPKEIVFAVKSDHISRFQTKKIRNPRKHINPPMAAMFEHPLIRKKIRRDIFDISTSGFSIRDEADDDVLMPGMMISDLSILLAGVSIATCSVQVIYRQEGDKYIKYGIAILDMDIQSYSRINHIIGINSDIHISVSTEIDMDSLWGFFFKTGFVYPAKYALCQAYREKFKQTYRKLYQDNPEIAGHITYEKNGRIYGHISTIRAYERSWLIHHHAAMPFEKTLPGFVVLKQMMIFLNGIYQLASAKTDYVICYFRPENKFPDRVFGGFARELDNPGACSLDLFAYLKLPAISSEKDFPDETFIRKSTPVDLWELEQFYRHNSGGLLMKILNTGSGNSSDESLEKIYERLGLLRSWQIFSLIHKDNLKAVFIVEQSDLAINMSDLLNCIKVLVIDSNWFSPELLFIAATKLGTVYNLDNITLLVYPAAYIESSGISCKKHYQLWIKDTRYSGQFMDYVQGKFRVKYE